MSAQIASDKCLQPPASLVTWKRPTILKDPWFSGKASGPIPSDPSYAGDRSCHTFQKNFCLVNLCSLVFNRLLPTMQPLPLQTIWEALLVRVWGLSHFCGPGVKVALLRFFALESSGPNDDSRSFLGLPNADFLPASVAYFWQISRISWIYL